MRKKLLLEICSAFFVLFFLFNSLDALLNLQSLKNLLKILPVIFQKYSLVAWVIVAVQFIIALLVFIKSTRIYGFIIAIAWTTLLMSYLVYTQSWPHEFAGVYNYLSFNQQLIVSGLVVLISVMSLIMIRKNSKTKHPQIEEHPVVFT